MFCFRKPGAALLPALFSVILLAACQAAPNPVTPTTPPVAGPSPAQASAAASPIAPPLDTPPNFTFSGISFSDGDTPQALKWMGRLVPRDLPDGLPEHIDIALANPDPGGFVQAHILVLPAAGLDETAALRAFRDRHPAASTAEPIPMIVPGDLLNGCRQVFAARASYMAFQGGDGVRFLTQYQCDPPGLVTNWSLAYAFQGLTSDGQFYVSVMLPIRHPSLPSKGKDMSKIPGFDAVTNRYTGDFAAYIGGVTAALDAAPPESFKRSLTELDSIVRSLSVKPPSPLASIFTPTPDLPTPTPALPITPAGPAAAPNVSQGGITFTLDPAIASSAAFSATAAELDGTPGTLSPAILRFDLHGYPLAGRADEGRIYITPIAGLDARRNELYLTEVARIRDLLDRRPAVVATGGNPTDGLPRLTLFQEAQGVQYFLSRIEYFDFQNGTGVRYVTEYTWENWPATNESLEYVYQGLTADGRCAVSIYLPIRHPYLPDHPAEQTTQAEREAFLNKYASYLSGITQALDSAAPADFTPNLGHLDALVKSLRVAPPTP